MTTPAADPPWRAARTGLPGDATASNRSAQVAQFLTSHGVTPVYEGAALVTPAGNVGFGSGGIEWVSLGTSDIDQPFAMPGGATATGRVTIPVSPAGNGADVTVSLWTDSAGAPGTLLASTVLPATHLAQLAAPDGLPGGPLATAASNAILSGDAVTVTPWASPVTSTGSAALPSCAQSGNYLIYAGGQVGGTTPVASVFTVGWDGGQAPGTVLPQPSLPVATGFGALVATADVLVFAGGVTNFTTFADVASVFTAGWSPDSGQVEAWTSQPSLPAATSNASGAFDAATDTVYIVGGGGLSGYTTAVWYARVVNGQITAWTAGPPLPAAKRYVAAGVIGGWLVAAGGAAGASPDSTDTWLAKVASDGSLGPWTAGPAAPAAIAPQNGAGYAVTASGLVTAPDAGGQVLTLPVTVDGPGQWAAQASIASLAGAQSPTAAFAAGDGQWQLITIFQGSPSGYASAPLASVPVISVPLPASGLTGGATYHLVLHQDGGTAADYVQAALDPSALPSAASTRPRAGGSWTGQPNGYSLFAGVSDQSPGGQAWHLWEDSGGKVTTLLWAGTGTRLLGALESTASPAGPLNANTLTTASGAGWNGFNGTFSVSGSPPAGAPNPDAGLYTQVGATAGAMEESGAPFQVTPGTWYRVSASAWTATTTVILGVDWLDSSGTYISTSVQSFTVTASTWTALATDPLIAPSGAAKAYPRVAPAAGTGNSVYATSVIASRVSAPRLPMVTQVTYDSAGLPSGTVQFA